MLILENGSVSSLVKLFAVLSLFVVAACSPGAQAPTSATASVGTKAVIKRGAEQIVAQITDVTDNIITTEYTGWHGEFLYTRREFKGLFPVGGTEKNGERWELDFDESALDPLFPLQKGTEVSFKGKLMGIDAGITYDMWAHVEVVGKKSLPLKDGEHIVYVIEFTSIYEMDGNSKRRTEVMYYDPKLSMTLKKVIQDARAQRFWRVVSVEKPTGNEDPDAEPLRQRRSGTVMI
jgi:hypothetical protein